MLLLLKSPIINSEFVGMAGLTPLTGPFDCASKRAETTTTNGSMAFPMNKIKLSL